MTTEARPDLEARARVRADAIVAAWNERDHATSEKLSDRLTAILLEHARELEALQRERDEARENLRRANLVITAAQGNINALHADLAAARAERDRLDERCHAYAKRLEESHEGQLNERVQELERDLAALRRRVGEAAREGARPDGLSTPGQFAQAFHNEAHALMVDAREDLADWVSRRDARWEGELSLARAAAGELRGMLREAMERLGDRPLSVSLPGSYGAAWNAAVTELLNRPDVIAATKEPTP